MANKPTPVQLPQLERLESLDKHVFQKPVKRINEGEDVSFFLTSKAYADIMTFILQLNISMFPTGEYIPVSNPSSIISQLKTVLEDFEKVIDEAPPDPGPRRFGNIAFKKWFNIVEERVKGVLSTILPALPDAALEEIQAYLLGSFGSAQRLDYGTGHELSFLAFIAGLWKLGCLEDLGNDTMEREIVEDVFAPYLVLVRRLILTYNLEPAGSHGVWGLDDHSFLPYIFGSAQLSPGLGPKSQIPPEGSAPNAPDPGDVTKAAVVEQQRKTNLYFGAIGFIYDVKKGPFWEHSPMLYDISGVQAGWAKINKGMIKMYNAEVLSKYPVVQHFPFGSLFLWDKDPDAIPPNMSTHVSSQPTAQASTRAPIASPGTTAAPWATNQTTLPPQQPTRQSASARGSGAPGSAAQPSRPVPPGSGMAPTRAPWAKE